MSNGVPFDTAFRLGEVDRTAFCIVFSEIHGNEFDWRAFRFKEESKK